MPLGADPFRSSSDKDRTRERYKRRSDTQMQLMRKAAKKRTAAAKKGAEGPKQSKPGGYARALANRPSGKKKRKA